MECSTVHCLRHYLTFASKSPKIHASILYRKPLFVNFDSSLSSFATKLICNNGSFSLVFSYSQNNINHNNALPSLVCRASSEEVREEDESNPEEIISGEWPENFAVLNYEDLRAYLEPEIFKDKMQPNALLGEVMSPVIRTATVDQTIEEIDHHFEFVSGLPVVDEGLLCIGVVSKKDKQRASNGLKSKVGEIMSSPAIVLSPDKTVLDAAILMLKEKFHRIPIVNENGQVVGMVTRTDIFNALEGLPA